MIEVSDQHILRYIFVQLSGHLTQNSVNKFSVISYYYLKSVKLFIEFMFQLGLKLQQEIASQSLKKKTRSTDRYWPLGGIIVQNTVYAMQDIQLTR